MPAGEQKLEMLGADLPVLGKADAEPRPPVHFLPVPRADPPLHLPVVAGLAQGPGFPNLSCLGLLSDRVLRRYVPLEEPAPRAPERRERV